MSKLATVADWPSTFDNSLMKDLREDPGPPHESRQVLGAHFTKVRPTVTAPKPALVAFSTDVSEQLGIDPADCESDDFLRFFSGSPPAELECWATVYGASFTGRYGGQRGDGRAVSVGQMSGKEVQLKGAGTTPYSRRSDGRAVLRSSIREFIAQEHMAALRVPTTRSLCVIATGEVVRRYWYSDSGAESVVREAGAVGTRVATSFLRFGQFEYFAQTNQLNLLRELADHALNREFPHLLRKSEPGTRPSARTYLAMYEEICKRQATLVAEWLRVGYCQGNMNSDNSALGGVTLDYGPFAFMERFTPFYNPWVGGGKPYSYGMQPNAASTNLAGLANAFAGLALSMDGTGGEAGEEMDQASVLASLRSSVSEGFGGTFKQRHAENCRAKLGLSTWDDEAQDLWDQLLSLMALQCGNGPAATAGASGEEDKEGGGFRMPWAANPNDDAPPSSPSKRAPEARRALAEVGCLPSDESGGLDFTLFFRSLGATEPPRDAEGSAESDASHRAALLQLLQPAALDSVESWPKRHVEAWEDWTARYWRRVAVEARGSERREEMARANPKFIMRNWMAKLAYEAAAEGDYSLVRELQAVLSEPYEEQGDEVTAKWAQTTPTWAREAAGLAFMS